MRVVIHISSLRVGGAEAVAVALANGLAEAGARVALAAADGPLAARVSERVERIPVDNVNRLPLHAINELRRCIEAFDPQVVHCHGAAGAVAVALATRGATRPVRILTHHSRTFWRVHERVAARVLARSADHFVAISHFKERQIRSWGVAPERITLLPNFLDTVAMAHDTDATVRQRTRFELGITDDTPVVCMAGRVIPAKGFDRFVSIVSRTAAQMHRRVVGVVVGDGSALGVVKKTAHELTAQPHSQADGQAEQRAEPHVEGQVRAMPVGNGGTGIARVSAGAVPPQRGASSRFHFTGYVPDASPWLAACDAVLFPSSHPEVLPMFLIEAAAAGRPAVVSSIEGNREVVIDGETGMVVDGDDDAFAGTLSQLLADVERRRTLGESARRRAQRVYDTQVVVGKTLAVYENAVRLAR